MPYNDLNKGIQEIRREREEGTKRILARDEIPGRVLSRSRLGGSSRGVENSPAEDQ
jgi:hypothetical protein